MEKFTRGPWSYEDDYVRDSRGNIIADPDYCDDIPRKEKEANAALISAAPDMFEALENLKDAVNHYFIGADHDPAIVESALDEARAALAKARGEV